jgi:signal transduction histidine kinase
MEIWQKQEEVRQLMGALLYSNGWLGEMTASRKDNTTFLAQVSAAAVKNEKGALICLMSSSLDITAKHEMELQLRQAYKMEAIGTLAGGIAHDFNNILSAILGYAEIAQIFVSGNTQADNAIQQVLKAGNRAKNLVAHILTFSRGSEMSQVPVEIGKVVNEALQLLRASIPTTIEIQSDIDPNCGTIIADPTQIHQVMMNLCTNAAHAMEDTGGLLKVSLKPVDLPNDEIVRESHLKPGTYIYLSISDTGPGIEPAIIERIFDPYFTTKEVGKGSGMGLAVVKGIVNSHDGVIKVTSELGKGAVFQVFFAKTEEDTLQEDEDQIILPTGNEHILVIDDDKSIVEMNRLILEQLGYKVTCQTSSTGALEIFRMNSDEFDLVLTDYTMPNITGESLAKEMLKIKPDIPIILCTGYSSKIDSDKARVAGIKAFAMKPLRPSKLSLLVRKVLDKS